MFNQESLLTADYGEFYFSLAFPPSFPPGEDRRTVGTMCPDFLYLQHSATLICLAVAPLQHFFLRDFCVCGISVVRFTQYRGIHMSLSKRDSFSNCWLYIRMHLSLDITCHSVDESMDYTLSRYSSKVHSPKNPDVQSPQQTLGKFVAVVCYHNAFQVSNNASYLIISLSGTICSIFAAGPINARN